MTLFPHAIAGPIVRYSDIAAQIGERAINSAGFAEGIRRFIVGLAKKVLVANSVAVAADAIFSIRARELTFGLSWLGIACYTLQIYFDFSGYSDMAIGLAKLFGIDFLENFNYPYAARSLSEFWRRWHISLSTWFRDYLYIPLGGNRRGLARTYVNLVIVFFLCGLWHGGAGRSPRGACFTDCSWSWSAAGSAGSSIHSGPPPAISTRSQSWRPAGSCSGPTACPMHPLSSGPWSVSAEGAA